MRVFLIILLCVVCSSPLLAVEPSTTFQTDRSSVDLEGFPGLSAVIPQATEMAIDLQNLQKDLPQPAQLDSVRLALQLLEQQTDLLQQEMQATGTGSELDPASARSFRTRIAQLQPPLRRTAETLQRQHQQQSDALLKWQQRRDYWNRWQQALQAAQPQMDTAGFESAQSTLQQALQSLNGVIVDLSRLQQQAGSLQVGLERMAGQLNVQQGFGASELTRRTDVPMTSPDFIRRLSATAWREAFAQVHQSMRFEANFIAEKGWVLFLQLLAAALLARLISRYRRREGDKADWAFWTVHPVAAATLISLATLSPLYRHPSALLVFLLWSVATFCGALLAATLLKDRCKLFFITLVAVLALSVSALDIASLPEPISRFLLACLAITALPLLWLTLARYRREHRIQHNRFTAYVQGTMVVSAVAAVALIGGYQAFGALLFEAILQSMLLGLMAIMLLHLLRGGIELATERLFSDQTVFFRQFGQSLAQRLKRLVLLLVVGLTFFSLLPLWGLADHPIAAWHRLMQWGFSIGDIEFTLGSLFSFLVIIYLATQLSWLLQSLMETEILAGKSLERGVRDAFKRLTDYAVLLVGFFIALNSAGFEMKQFAFIAGAFSLGIGFGLQNIVNNFVSGLILLFERPVKVGDMVNVAGHSGFIVKIGLRSTVVEAWNRSEVIVPNSQLVSEAFTNSTLSNTSIRIELPVGVSYSSDVNQVTDILQQIARNHPDVLQDPEPSAVFVGFGDSSLNFNLRFWIQDAFDQVIIRSAIGKTITQSFRANGVEIPFPQRDLHLRSTAPGLMSEPANSD